MSLTQILLVAMFLAAAMAGFGTKMELPPHACNEGKHVLLL